MGLMQFLKEKKLDISLMMVLVGGAILFISVMSFMADSAASGFWSEMNNDLEGWMYWLILTGGAIFVGGAYYLWDFSSKRRELNKLLEITSKSKFIKNQDRIEELAWRLGGAYETKVVERKKKLKVK